MIRKFDIPVTNVAWNQLAVNGLVVEIILACTAIESIALFSGIIPSATGATPGRKVQAFMISVPVVYVLNIIRVSFTASAYGLSWFGTPDESFHISEHFITKAGSLLALLLISYYVLKLMPEVADRWYPEDDEDRISEIDIKVIMKIKVNHELHDGDTIDLVYGFCGIFHLFKSILLEHPGQKALNIFFCFLKMPVYIYWNSCPYFNSFIKPLRAV